MRRNPVAAIVAVAGLCLLIAGVTRADVTTATHATYALRPCSTCKEVRYPTEQECREAAEAEAQRVGLTRETGAAVYTCITRFNVIATFRPNPTCPALPAPEGRVVDCPTGFTGAYTQTRSYTAAPYPTCSTLGEWTPTEPPTGICVPIPPPTAEQWTFCADEYQTCSFTGTRRARFGLNSSWVERDVTAVDGGVPCRIATFGSDPLVGVAKRCELSSTTPEPVPDPAGSASLSWTPPTQNTDGTTLTNLAGYRISYGTSAQALVQTVQVANAGASGYTIGNLTPGTYYFAVRAYTSDGTESASSNFVAKTVTQ